jgi:hypothetical protein
MSAFCLTGISLVEIWFVECTLLVCISHHCRAVPRSCIVCRISLVELWGVDLCFGFAVVHRWNVVVFLVQDYNNNRSVT